MKELVPLTHDQISSEFQRKFSDAPYITGFYPLYVFDNDAPIRALLHKLKYSNTFRAGKFLGVQIAKTYQTQLDNFNADMIIPIPLHRLKKAERGYNQAYWIAKGISERLNIPVAKRVAKRVKYTESQTTFSKGERQQNISGAFRVAASGKINGKKIILVDDVVTTGATTRELAKLLSTQGASAITLVSAAMPLL
jgi:ComF family protein